MILHVMLLALGHTFQHPIWKACQTQFKRAKLLHTPGSRAENANRAIEDCP